MSEIRKVKLPEKDQPLRADISMLGQLLGEVLVENDGGEQVPSLIRGLHDTAAAIPGELQQG